MWLMLKSFMDFFKDESLRLLLEHLRINSSTDIGSMIVSEAGLGHVEKLKNLLKAHPEKVRGFYSTIPVSYTHLTLPTKLEV